MVIDHGTQDMELPESSGYKAGPKTHSIYECMASDRDTACTAVMSSRADLSAVM